MQLLQLVLDMPPYATFARTSPQASLHRYTHPGRQSYALWCTDRPPQTQTIHRRNLLSAQMENRLPRCLFRIVADRSKATEEELRDSGCRLSELVAAPSNVCAPWKHPDHWGTGSIPTRPEDFWELNPGTTRAWASALLPRCTPGSQFAPDLMHFFCFLRWMRLSSICFLHDGTQTAPSPLGFADSSTRVVTSWSCEEPERLLFSGGGMKSSSK